MGSARSVLEWEALLGDKSGGAIVNPADPGFWFCSSSVEAQRDGLSGLRPFLLFLWCSHMGLGLMPFSPKCKEFSELPLCAWECVFF